MWLLRLPESRLSDVQLTFKGGRPSIRRYLTFHIRLTWLQAKVVVSMTNLRKAEGIAWRMSTKNPPHRTSTFKQKRRHHIAWPQKKTNRTPLKRHKNEDLPNSPNPFASKRPVLHIRLHRPLIGHVDLLGVRSDQLVGASDTVLGTEIQHLLSPTTSKRGQV